VTEVFAGFGARMVRAKAVAGQALKEARQYIGSGRRSASIWPPS